MTLNVTAIAAVGAFAAGLIAAGAVQGWRYEAQLSTKDSAYSKLQRDHADDLKAISDKAQAATDAALQQQQAAEKRAAALDQQHTQELTNEKAENDRLRALYSGATADAAHERRLRISAKCPVAAGGNVVPGAGAASSVGDATSVELSRDAGQAVFDIREGMKADRRKLAYLQDFVRTECKAP